MITEPCGLPPSHCAYNPYPVRVGRAPILACRCGESVEISVEMVGIVFTISPRFRRTLEKRTRRGAVAWSA